AAHALLGQAQATVDGRPAGGLGVHEMPRAAAPLPDPLVGFAPARDRGLDELAEEAPFVVVGRVAARVPAPGEIEDLAEGVELQLVGGVVARAHRTRAVVAPEVEAFGGDPALAADPEEDLQVVC